MAAGVFGVLLSGVANLLTAAPVVAATGINHTVSFQGKVTNTNGTNVANGSYSFVFSIYTVSTGGSAVWTETKSLTVTDGIFQTNLGDTTTLPGSVDFNTDNIYLGMAFNSDPEMLPRIRFTAVPQAFNSEKLGGLAASAYAQLNPGSAQSGSLNVTGTVQAATSLQAPLVDNTGTLGLGTQSGTTGVTVGRNTSTTNLTLQGSASTSWSATGASGSTTVGFAAPTATNAITFPNAGGTVCTTVSSTCSATYQAAGSYLLKGATDTSSAAVTASNYLYGFTNSSSAVASGVLNLDNGTNTGTTLNVATAGNPGAGKALIVANNTNGTPSGNLLDLQVGGTSKYSINVSGNSTQSGTLTVSGAGTSSIMGSLGLGTANPQGALTVTNGAWITSIDSAGTGYVNMFSVNSNNEIQAGAAINLDGGIVLPTDGGQVTFADMGFSTSGVTAGTPESYTFRVGSANALTVYGENDGSGNAQNVRVAVGSSITPAYTLDIGGTLGASGAVTLSSTLGVSGAATFSAANPLTLGTAGTSNGGITFKSSNPSSASILLQASTSLGVTARTITLPDETGTVCTTAGSVACTAVYAAAAAGGYLAKNATDSSSAAVTAANYLYTFSNTGSAVAGGVLKLDNNNNTASTLLVTGSGNPGAGAAFVKVNNTNVSPSGNLIDLQSNGTSVFAVNFAGVTTLAGGQTKDITTATAATSANLTVGPGISSAATGTGSTLSLRGGDESGTTTAVGGAVVLQGGNATGGSGTRTGGNVTIDAGTGSAASTNGTISIGATNALSLTLGNNTNTTTTTLQSGSGGLNITSTSNGVVTTTGSFNINAGAASTWRTTTGNLTVQANGSSTLNLETTGAGTINLGQNNSTTINVASNSNTARTINIGNVASGTQTQLITVGSAAAGATNVTLQAGTAGVNLNPAVNSPTNINTGGSTGTITLGGGSANLVIDSVGFDVTSGGLATLGASTGTGGLANNGSTVNTAYPMSNLASGGWDAGGAVATVDKYTYISANQTSSGQTLTIPTPTANTAYGRLLFLSNIGNQSFTLLGTTIGVGSTATLVWANKTGGAGWTFAGADGSGILNQNASAQTADFFISGVGKASSSFQAPLFDSISGGLNIGTTTATGVTIGGAATTGTIAIGSAAASTVNIGTGAFAHTIEIGTDATTVQGITVGSSSGASGTTLVAGSGNINLNAAAITTNATTVALLNTTATTVNAFGAATAINMGAPSAVLTLGNTTGTGTLRTSAGALTVQGASALNLNTVNVAGAATGAVTITSGNVTSGAFASGSIGIDVGTSTGTTGTVSVGVTSASAISIGHTGITTTIAGTTQLGAATGTGAFLNNGSTVNTSYPMANLASGGWDAGGAAATVDKYTYITANQTTTLQTLTPPTPTANTTYGRLLYVTNGGTASFTMLGTSIGAGSTATLIWSLVNAVGTWTYAGADGSGILNQNAADQTANFRISGTGRANTSFIAPAFDAIAAGSLSFGAATATTIQIGSNGATNPVINLDSGTGAINVGTGAQARTIAIGTGAAVQGVTIGSTTAGSTTNIQGPAVTVGTAGASLFRNNGATANTVCAYTGVTGATTLNTAGKTPDVCTAFTLTTVGAATITVPTPAAGAGAIVYISNMSASTNAITLLGSQLGIGSTATLVYNGTVWTYAGADASGLQTAYNNSVGGTTPEILLDSTRNGVDIQDANSTLGNTVPLLAVRSAASASTLGNPLFTVTNNAGVPLVGIGTNVASRALDVATNTISTTALPVIVQQAGTGDAGIEVKTAAQSYYMGIDNSDSSKFKISSSNAGGGTSTVGYNTTVGGPDTSNQDNINAIKITVPLTGTITTLSAYVSTIGVAPNNKAKMAIYANGGTGQPAGAALATSSETTLTNGLAWNQFTFAGLAVTSGQVIWLTYDTNGNNNLYYNTGLAGDSWFIGQVYSGVWPSITVGTGTTSNQRFNIYGTIASGSGVDNFTTSLFQMSSTGNATFENSTDSATAFQVQNAASSTNVLQVDTSNSRVGIGLAVASAEAAGSDLAFGGGADRTIAVNTRTTTGAGRALTVVAGAGNAGAGGQLNLLGGAGVGTNQAGGAVALTGGTATGTAAGGAVTVSGGAAGGLATGGALMLQGGAASATAGSSSGAITVRSAAGAAGAGATAGGAAGVVSITGGNGGAGTGTNSSGAAGAAVNLLGGTGGAATGTGTNGNGGAITITGGTAGLGGSTGTPTGGALTMQGGAAAAVAGSAAGGVAINGGVASTTGNGGIGGSISIVASNAGGAGNNNGGNITLTAGNATGSGTPGVVNIDTPVFTAITATGSYVQSANNQTFNMAVADINSASTVVVTLTGAFTGATVTVPAPTNTTTGRVVYITNGSASIPFTLSPLGSSAITMNVNSTATLVWNNATSTWTAAGADASTSLQQVYNNTATSPVSIVTSSAAKYLNFQAGVGADTSNTFQVASSAGAQVISVDTTNSATGANLGQNGGGETGGTPPTGWSAFVGTVTPTITQTTTASEISAGAGAVKVAFGSAGTGGVNNALNAAALATAATTYNLSFSIKAVTSAPTNTNLIVEYYRNSTPTLDATCSANNAATNPAINTTSFIKYTCYFTTTGNAKATTNFLRIRQADSVARSWMIDNLSLTVANLTGAQNTSVLRVGGANSQGLTLLTVDSYASAPYATGSTINTDLLGSLYYDTTIGKLQCYEAKGWGSCGNSPNNSAFLIPEYPNAVLGVKDSGTPAGVGTMTAGLCSGTSHLSLDTTLCSVASDDFSYYKWTTPQASFQYYSIYVRYQLPATYNGFLDANTIKLYGRTSSTTDGSVSYSLWSSGYNGACGALDSPTPHPITTVTTSNNTWQQKTLDATETTTSTDCTFAANDIITFRIDMAARNGATVYASNLTFTTKGL